jgi:hypothetical protein
MHSHSSLWIAPPKSDEERAAELDALCRHVARTERREFLSALAAFLGFGSAGVLLIGWSFASTDPTWAPIAFWAGLGLGYGGILLTLAETLRRHLENDG